MVKILRASIALCLAMLTGCASPKESEIHQRPILTLDGVLYGSRYPTNEELSTVRGSPQSQEDLSHQGLYPIKRSAIYK